MYILFPLLIPSTIEIITLLGGIIITIGFSGFEFNFKTKFLLIS